MESYNIRDGGSASWKENTRPFGIRIMGRDPIELSYSLVRGQKLLGVGTLNRSGGYR